MAWGPIEPDFSLWSILEFYKKVVGANDSSARRDDYLSVLSCFYAVGPDSDAAFLAWQQASCEYDEEICESGDFVVAAWGLHAPYPSRRNAIDKIKRWLADSPGKQDPLRTVVYIDPNLPDGSQIADNASALDHASSPGSPAFVRNLEQLASRLSGYCVGSTKEEDVMQLGE